MPSKIAFIIHGLQVGGAEKFFVDLVNGFQASGQNPIVIVLSGNNALAKDIRAEIPCFELSRKHKYDFGVSLRIRKIILEHRISKVFCVEGFSFFMAKNLFIGNKKVKFFLSLHSTLPISRKRYYLDLFYLRFFGKKDRTIFICEYQRRLFRSKYHFSPALSDVIYNGINHIHFSRNKTVADLEPLQFEWRSAFGIPDDAKIVLMIGRISIEKGHVDAIYSLKQIHEKHGLKAHLVIVGNGSTEIQLEIEKKRAELGLSDYIHMAGAKKDVRPYLYDSDIFTLTSFSETFSIAALEALSMEVPCSLTEVGGAKEMLAEGRLGVLSKPRDPDSIAESWYRLLNNMPEPRVIRNYVETHYTVDKMITTYIDCLSLN